MLKELNLFDNLREMILEGLPLLETSAGMTLLANIINNDSQIYFGEMKTQTRYNIYGKYREVS